MHIDIADIIKRAAGLGVLLHVEGEELKFKLKVKVFPPDIKQEIIANKSAIIDFLSQLSAGNEAGSVHTEIAKVQRHQQGLPTSFAQRRLLLIDKLQGGTPEYNSPKVLTVSGNVDLALLNKVFNTIIERHEVIRTIYSEVDGDMYQHIQSMSQINFTVDVQDLTHLDETLRHQEASRLIADELKRPFDLSEDLMLRVSYFKTQADVGYFILNMHHIATDGWSMEVLTKEFFTLYDAFYHNKQNPLPMLDIQYADYAAWQRSDQETKKIATQLQYWEQHLDNLPSVHSLPLDTVRSQHQQHQGAMISQSLSKEVTQRLMGVANTHKLTPFMLFHAALSLLISRHANTHDIVVGTPVANRTHDSLAPLIGFFVNTLVLRANTAYDTLSDYLHHIRQVHLKAQANQDVPFEQLVDRLKVPRNTDHSPLFQIMITTNTDYGVSNNAHVAALTDLDIRPYRSQTIAAKFDLDIALNLHENGADIHWTYDTSLFNEKTVARLSEHLCRLMTGISEVGETNTAIRTLPMLSHSEQQHLVYDLNDNTLDYPVDRCIHELFEHQVEQTPNHVAIIFADQQLTYQALNERANRLANYLIEMHHIKPDTLVGLCVERSVDMVVGILGILKAGGAYLPIDPSYPQERIDYIIDDASLSTIVSHESALSVLADYSGDVVNLDERVAYDYFNPDNLACATLGLGSTHLAYVIYTSGSTGKPKGVMVEHRSVVNLITAQKVSYGFEQLSYETGILLANYAFDASVEQLFLMLLTGAKVIIPSRAELLSADQLCSYISRYKVTHLDSTPSHLLSFIGGVNFDHIRRMVSGGEGFIPQLLELSDTQIFNVYGPTEACVTSHVSKSHDSIGKSISNCQTFVLSDTQQLVAKGCVGELYIGGDGLARGYLNRPQLSAERFIANPFYDATHPNSSERLYRTGDLVRYLPDGNLEFIGRVDDQVKIRGFRIELGEVEAQLAAQAGVDSALVMAKELAGAQQLVGYIQANGALDEAGQRQLVAQVKESLANCLPDYMVPSVLMVVNTWPLTANGKIDKKALPQPDGSVLQGEYVGPCSEAEDSLVRIFSQLLDIDADKISTTANFFELGGHSLLSIRLISL
ncbi:non-ribosomal peptide synthetase, partial [Pseudoalteromonas amylolytica]|uniref:non-ribosomal peptide synthetase n=2 Tax=Pseudoalteromonas TaxID=53246 RepID=UPI000A66BA5C